jgi:hypothetical protein
MGDDFRDEKWLAEEQETRDERASGYVMRFTNAHSAIDALYAPSPLTDTPEEQ